MFEDVCGIAIIHQSVILSQDNFLSICDVLKYGIVVCHIQRGTTVLKSTRTPLTQRSDGSQLLNQGELLSFFYSLKAIRV